MKELIQAVVLSMTACVSEGVAAAVDESAVAAELDSVPAPGSRGIFASQGVVTLGGGLVLDLAGAEQFRACMAQISLVGGVGTAAQVRNLCIRQAALRAYVLPGAREAWASGDWSNVWLRSNF